MLGMSRGKKKIQEFLFKVRSRGIQLLGLLSEKERRRGRHREKEMRGTVGGRGKEAQR